MLDQNLIDRPGGVCVLSTPNILNVNSRLRFLWFGFAELLVHCRLVIVRLNHVLAIYPLSRIFIFTTVCGKPVL